MIRELLRKAQDTVEKRAKPVTQRLSARAAEVLEAVEHRAPAVAARIRPAVERVRDVIGKPIDLEAREKPSSTAPRTEGRKTVASAQPSAKRATKKERPAGPKVKRGQKHRHQR